MGPDDKESSGIVCAVSKQVGTITGTSVVISKKIAGLGIKPVTAAKDWLGQSLKIFKPARDKKSSSTFDLSALELRGKQETSRKKAAKVLIAVLESDLVVAQHELQKARNNAEKTHSNLTLQLSDLKEERESLISDLEQAKSVANEATFREGEVKMRVAALGADLAVAQRQLDKSHKKEKNAKSQRSSNPIIAQPKEETMLSDIAIEEKVAAVSTSEEAESEIKPTVAQSNEELNVKAEKQLSRKVIKAETPAAVTVTNEQVQATVFPNATDKVIFMRALSDIASQDAAVRVDAAKAMAGVHHELSVKTLAGRMVSESSVRVRQECIKALTTLQMTEGLDVVERALSDRAALVRLAAVWGLYRLAGAGSGPALVRMLSDEDVEVRRRAATCISWLGREELAVELLPLLDDSSVSVRLAVVEAMGNLRCRRVVTTLIEHLNDPEKAVRKAVLGVLKTITGKKMSGPFPKDKKALQCLIARWRGWWKEEQAG